MSAITINTTARQDKAIKALTDEYNNVSKSNLTPIQYMSMELRTLMDRMVNKADNLVNFTDVYNKATPEDQATIDSIKAKYSNT